MKSCFCLPLLAVLLLSACYSGQRREMLALLDEADSLNRTYAPLPSDSLLRQAADFFDRHGSPGEQVRAHYLLGCAYRDQGQAPEALQSYQDALDRADTLSSDCDFQRLMAVYGQMAELYHAQGLPHDELAVSEWCEHFALRIGDTLGYIRNLELKAVPYEQLGDTVSMLRVLQHARELYLDNGYHKEAVQTLGVPIFVAVERGELDSAYAMMREYESKSGLFDSGGNIVQGREVYYYIKGLYYQKRMQLDSAEYYMRRLLACGQELNGYRGLLDIYGLRGFTDSVVHFARLFEKATDVRNGQRETETIHQMSSLYDYTHSERVAYEKTLATKRLQLLILCLSFLSILVVSVLFALFRRVEMKRRKAVERYLQNFTQLRNIRKELAVLQESRNAESLVAKKESEQADLEREVFDYQQSIADSSLSSEAMAIEKTEICRHFRVLEIRGNHPSEDDWQELENAFEMYLPETYAFIDNHRHLMDSIALHVCLLVRLGIKPTPISHMLGVSDAYISIVRRQMLTKIFGITGKPKEFDAAIQKLN